MLSSRGPASSQAKRVPVQPARCWWSHHRMGSRLLGHEGGRGQGARDTGQGLRSPPPRTKYKTPLSPKIHPKIHPESSPEIKIRKKYEYTKIGGFLYIFRIFSVLWFRERIRGVFWGVFWGSEGFCILYGAEEIASQGGLWSRWIPCMGHTSWCHFEVHAGVSAHPVIAGAPERSCQQRSVIVSLASRKRCAFENVEMLRFAFRTPAALRSFLRLFPRFFLQF